MLILVGKESAILSQFHDHIDSVILDERVPEFDDVGVVDYRMQVDFPFKKQELVVAAGVADIDLNSEADTTLTA
jgi:hypothetical protein